MFLISCSAGRGCHVSSSLEGNPKMAVGIKEGEDTEAGGEAGSRRGGSRRYGSVRYSTTNK